jgi:hypothetical protein
MLKNLFLPLLLGMALCTIASRPVIGQLTPDDHSEKIKSEIERILSGKRSKVVVKMKSGSDKKGYIARAEIDSFELWDSASGKRISIDYLDVEKVKKTGMSKGAKTAMWVGVAAGAVVLLVTLPKPGLGAICPLGCTR